MTRLEIRGDYTADWPEIAAAVKGAAGWRCVRCRHPFDPRTGQPLACDSSCDPRRCRAKRIADRDGAHNYGVHHLDGDKGNNAWWNTLALCNSCHLYVQASVIPARPFMLAHSAWFVPYVCGYFAHVHGLEITRADADANPNKYLALGQPWLFASATEGQS